MTDDRRVHDIVEGDRVRVKKAGDATFQAHGRCRKAGDFTTWTDDPPRPWYPHGEDVTVRRIDDALLYLRSDDGTEWPFPVGFWAVELRMDLQ